MGRSGARVTPKAAAEVWARELQVCVGVCVCVVWVHKMVINTPVAVRVC